MVIDRMISQGKCISYLVALLEARQATVQRGTRRTAHQDVMNLSSFSRFLNHGAVHCARCLISREQLYLYTIGLFLYFKRMLLIMYLYHSLPIVHITASNPRIVYALCTSNPRFPGLRSQSMVTTNHGLRVCTG